MSHAASRLAFAVAVGRAAFWLGITACVITLAAMVYERGQRQAAATARMPLHAGIRLAASDLVSDEIEALAGRYLRREAKAGEPITRDMTSERRMVDSPGNSLAVILTIPAPTASQPLPFAKGDAVDVQDGDKTLANGEILDLDCDPRVCSVVVGIDHTSANAGALRRATLRPTALPTDLPG